MNRINTLRVVCAAALTLGMVNVAQAQAEQKTAPQTPPPARVTTPDVKKADLSNLVLKSELANYATKADLDEIRGRLERLRERLAKLRGGAAATVAPSTAPMTTPRP